MGKYESVLIKGRHFRQWIPTEKGEKVPLFDPWDGCPICGASPLPKAGEDPATTGSRLKLIHDSDTHEAWAQKYRREFQEDVREMRGRMERPTEPERS